MKKYNDYSVSRKDYYEHLVSPKNVSFFNEIFNNSKRVLQVDLPVVFRELSFGERPEGVAKQLGEPRYVVESYGISSLVFFYKEVISNHKIITQLHFLGEEFFYAAYSFRHKSPGETMVIRKLLFEKYSKMNGDTAERYDHMIDREGNIISVYDNVNFNIVYLWGDKKVKTAVTDNIAAAHRQEKAKIIKLHEDLLNKL